MERDPIRVCELLVGLPDVRVLGVVDVPGEPLVVVVETRGVVPICAGCGRRADLKDRDSVDHVDLAVFGRPARLRWVKRRWRCLNPACPQGSWTEINDEIVVGDRSVTTRAARWATRQVGEHGRTVSEVAHDLVCDSHTVNDTVVEWGEALLSADETRFDQVTGLGLDETLFCRRGRWRAQAWATSIVDVGAGQLLDVVEGRTAAGPAGWLDQQPETWRAAIRYGVLDLSGPYRATFDTMLPHVDQIADPFHLVKLANQRLDERGRIKLLGLLDAGDPHGEVRTAWHATRSRAVDLPDR